MSGANAAGLLLFFLLLWTSEFIEMLDRVKPSPAPTHAASKSGAGPCGSATASGGCGA
jgi:hypothetical protein